MRTRYWYAWEIYCCCACGALQYTYQVPGSSTWYLYLVYEIWTMFIPGLRLGARICPAGRNPWYPKWGLLMVPAVVGAPCFTTKPGMRGDAPDSGLHALTWEVINTWSREAARIRLSAGVRADKVETVIFKSPFVNNLSALCMVACIVPHVMWRAASCDISGHIYCCCFCCVCGHISVEDSWAVDRGGGNASREPRCTARCKLHPIQWPTIRCTAAKTVKTHTNHVN